MWPPGISTHLLQPLQAPSQLANLPPQGTLIKSSLTNWGPRRGSVTAAPALPLFAPCSHRLTGHIEDAGTGWGLWGPLPASTPIQAQHQAGRAATGETARRIEAAMRAESDTGSAFIHIYQKEEGADGGGAGMGATGGQGGPGTTSEGGRADSPT